MLRIVGTSLPDHMTSHPNKQ